MNERDFSSETGYKRATLRNFLTVVFKRKRLILGCFFGILAVVTLVTFILPPTYQANSKILVEKEQAQEKSMLFRMNLPVSQEGIDWVKSEVEIINSYPVVSRVVQDLGLEMEKPEDAAQVLPLELEKAIKRFRKKFGVESARNSNIIEVSYESKDPQLAAQTVTQILDTYLRYRSQVFDESDTYRFFEDQMEVADRKLKDLEQDLASFKNQQEMISPEVQSEILLTKLADYEKNLTAVQTDIIGKEAKLSVIVDQLKNGRDPIIPSTEASNSLSNEKYIAKLKSELLDMEIQRDRLLQRFTPSYEEVVELQNRIEATKKIIRAEIEKILEQERTAIRALKAEERALQQSIAQINEQIKKFAEKEFEFAQLSRGIGDNQEVYSMLLKQREEARISLAKLQRGVKVKIISPAVVPQKPEKPRKRLNLILGALLGLMTGFGLAFFLESNDPRISTVDELERIPDLPVLGAVRDIKAS